MKKSVSFLLLLLCSLVLVFAHSVSFVSFSSVVEDVSSVFNVSVVNADSGFDANISSVAVVLPSSFSFVSSSNGTNVSAYAFSSSSSTLTWSYDGLVMNASSAVFWFNASASTPGDYNLTVQTTNVTGTFSSNLSVTVNDSTVPSVVSFLFPSSNFVNDSASFIPVNVSVTDNGVVDTVFVRVYNSSFFLVNSSLLSSSPYFFNATGLGEGDYYLNVTANDSFGNENDSSTFTFTLDTTDPSVSLGSPSDDAELDDEEYSFTFTPSDASGLSSCELVLNGSSVASSSSISSASSNSITYSSLSDNEFYSWLINCTDTAGNEVSSSSRTFTTDFPSSSSSSSSSSGSSYKTFTVSPSTLKGGYERSLYDDWRIRFKLDDKDEDYHLFRILDIDVDAEEVDIRISSDPIEATIDEGDEEKFDVDDDGTYDLLVSVVEIFGSSTTKARADIRLSLIDEPASSVTGDSSSSSSSSDSSLSSGSDSSGDSVVNTDSSSSFWLWVVVVLVLVLVVVFFSSKRLRLRVSSLVDSVRKSRAKRKH